MGSQPMRLTSSTKTAIPRRSRASRELGDVLVRDAVEAAGQIGERPAHGELVADLRNLAVRRVAARVPAPGGPLLAAAEQDRVRDGVHALLRDVELDAPLLGLHDEPPSL